MPCETCETYKAVLTVLVDGIITQARNKECYEHRPSGSVPEHEERRERYEGYYRLLCPRCKVGEPVARDADGNWHHSWFGSYANGTFPLCEASEVRRLLAR
jgi:hypothetical protein